MSVQALARPRRQTAAVAVLLVIAAAASYLPLSPLVTVKLISAILGRW